MDHLPPTDSPPMSVAYLEKLNPEQRRAVEHGVRENDAALGAPLLVIAGAGPARPTPWRTGWPT
jgi:DNA helicase-2/ATP-dependent DNA helicase PcrA